VSIFRSYTVTLEQFNSWNFNGTFLGSGVHLTFTSSFKNKWNFSTNVIFHSGGYDTRILRGGYDFLMPYNFTIFGSTGTDKTKNIMFMLSYNYEYAGNKSLRTYKLQPGIIMRPFSKLKIGVSADYEKNQNMLQYVGTLSFLNEKRYILGTIDQKTLGLTFRVDLNLNPELSIQYYGSPFVSRGSYSNFKHVTNPRAGSYGERFELFDNVVFSENTYFFDENNDSVNDYSIENPDFNFHQFRSNLVVKWEYRLGSFIYLVWSSDRTERTSSADVSVGESYRQLSRVFPNNIFLLKLSYWFSL
jgi:hypothetical protein